MTLTYQYDKETGLYYLNARMYDPTIARFLQEDTYYGDPNDPLSLNLYTYCHNEPLMYYDPTGHYYQKQYVAGQGLVDVWVNETGFFGAIKNVNHAVEEALENVRDKMTDITSSVNGRIKSFAAEQVDRTKEGFVALTNSEKRKEAFELIDEYGSESDKILSRVYAGSACVTGTLAAAGTVVLAAYAAPSLATVSSNLSLKIATTSVGSFLINNAEKIINKAETITGAIRTGADVLAGDFKSAALDGMATLESFFTGKLMTANGAPGSRNKKIFTPVNQSSIDPKYGQKYNQIVNSVNRSSAGVGNGNLPAVVDRRAEALQKQLKAAAGEGSGPVIELGEAGPSFASPKLLRDHFTKHGKEFRGMYKDSFEYLEGARELMRTGTKVEYLYKGETRIGYVRYAGNSSKGVAKFDFVGTNNAGNITTYHIESGKDFWKMLNKGNNIQNITPIK